MKELTLVAITRVYVDLLPPTSAATLKCDSELCLTDVFVSYYHDQ